MKIVMPLVLGVAAVTCAFAPNAAADVKSVDKASKSVRVDTLKVTMDPNWCNERPLQERKDGSWSCELAVPTGFQEWLLSFTDKHWILKVDDDWGEFERFHETAGITYRVESGARSTSYFAPDAIGEILFDKKPTPQQIIEITKGLSGTVVILSVDK